MALGTLGLFVFAMGGPAGLCPADGGLEAVPEPLWWLCGCDRHFYFGAAGVALRNGAAPPSPAARAMAAGVAAGSGERSGGEQPGPVGLAERGGSAAQQVGCQRALAARYPSRSPANSGPPGGGGAVGEDRARQVFVGPCCEQPEQR